MSLLFARFRDLGEPRDEAEERATFAEIDAKLAEIDALVDPEVRILRGTEADILANGAIDVPAELVGELDVIIASVHQRYHLDRDAMTARLIAAMTL